MKYTYAYKTSDGTRHEAAMEAASREAVFEELRRQGIKAIKVVAADGSKGNGEVRGIRKRAVAAMVCIAAVVVGICVYVLTAIGDAASIRNPNPAQPTRKDTLIATPLPRQFIPGRRDRVSEAAASFTNAAERLLAAFAEPGRPVASLPPEKPTQAEFEACLREPLRYAEEEFTESVDMKRIVTKIKGDLRRYLEAGGTLEEFIAELVKRQRLEVSYREKAERRLGELLKAKDPKPAYDFWLQANAQLQSMGIYPLPLPDALRDYQFNLNLDE